MLGFTAPILCRHQYEPPFPGFELLASYYRYRYSSTCRGLWTLDMTSFVDAFLHGVGQVIFLHSTTCGALILAALCYGDLWLAVLATVGTLSATVSARAFNTDTKAIQAGLFGYNGCLVGCAFSVFLGLRPWSITSFLATILCAGVTAPCVSVLKPICGSMPQWTLAFNFLTLAVLYLARMPQDTASISTDASTFSALNWGCALLTGISQIFVVNDALAGAIILGTICYYSPMCAVHTLFGSCIGIGMALACGAPTDDIVMGLWGFNPALTSLAISVFFVPGLPSYTLAAVGSVATAALFGVLKSAMGSTPTLTVPFCIIVSGCYMLHTRVPRLVLAASPHSPEKNALQ